jgi:acyl-CoA synthetase (AMP-forming)/AMP-acid ligase II
MLTLGELINRNARKFSDRESYVEIDRRRTWRELDRRTDALGRVLRGWGVRPGDRIGVILKDSIEVVETIAACAKVGAVRVGLNYRLAPPELGALIDDAGVDQIFVQADLVDGAKEALTHSDRQPRLIGICKGHNLPDDYEALIAEGTADDPLSLSQHERLMICYTTGSTGLPKGAIYPHRQMIEST